MIYKVVKGSTIKINSTAYIDQDRSAVANLAGASIRAMFKKSFSDLDSEALYTKDIGTGVTIISAAAGTFQTLMPASENLNLSYNLIYFETLVKLADGSYIRSGIEQIEFLSNVAKVLN